MALSTDIYTILLTNADVLSTFGTRIYPVLAPENATFPYITYQLTSLTTNENKTYANKFDECYITVSVFHTDLTNAEVYGNYVRTAMNRYTGTIGSDKVMGVGLQSQSWEAEFQVSESGASTGLAIYSVQSQWKILIAQNISE